jgi:outer membrane protein assembly factor BamB
MRRSLNGSVRWGCASLLVIFLGHAGLALAGPTDWPEFRGPLGNGIVTQPGEAPRGLPLQWSETENVKWKTAIHDKGWSTPVVLGGQVWMTTATPEGNDFFAVCVDAETGKILFDQKLFHSDNPEPLGQDVNCYASPSPVIEPGRVWVNFGSYGTACLDTKTFKIIWQRTDLPCRHYRGPGSSLYLWKDLLYLTMDGVDVEYVAALDKVTGKTVWKADRTTTWLDLDDKGQKMREGDFRKAFTTPLVMDVNGVAQIISPSSYAAFAYDALSGREIWKIHHTAYSPAPRPVFGNGISYLITGRGMKAELLALRPDGKGDVTDTNIVWKAEGKIIPNESSPLLADGLIYMVSNDGAATCLDAATGAQAWTEKIGGNYLASPIYADGRIYCCNNQGKTTVLKPGRTFEVLATSKLDDGFMSSPAVSGKALFLRTKTTLYRIEQ